jgi:hypothetical protein
VDYTTSWKNAKVRSCREVVPLPCLAILQLRLSSSLSSSKTRLGRLNSLANSLRGLGAAAGSATLGIVVEPLHALLFRGFLILSLILSFVSRLRSRDGYLMSIQTCRDAQCNRTHSLPDPRIAPSILEYRQVQCASVLQFSFF